MDLCIRKSHRAIRLRSTFRVFKFWCSEPESNRHAITARDFKSLVSTYFTIGAKRTIPTYTRSCMWWTIFNAVSIVASIAHAVNCYVPACAFVVYVLRAAYSLPYAAGSLKTALLDPPDSNRNLTNYEFAALTIMLESNKAVLSNLFNLCSLYYTKFFRKLRPLWTISISFITLYFYIQI